MWTLIRRRAGKRRHLYNGRGGTPERSLTLCGQRIVPHNAVLIHRVVDPHKIDCEECLIEGIRLAARRDELRSKKR